MRPGSINGRTYEKYSATRFTECYESTLANSYSKYYIKCDFNTAMCSINKNNNTNTDTYSNYASNTCGECKVFNTARRLRTTLTSAMGQWGG